MIKKYLKLNTAEKENVKLLIKECENYDCSIVPIQFDHSLNYYKNMHSWFIYFEENEVIGVVSIFNPLSDVAEVSGCMKPNKRSKGKFIDLVNASYSELKIYNIQNILFVVDNDSKSGMHLANKLSLKSNHVEYLMSYKQQHSFLNTNLQIYEACLDNIEDFIRINSELFNEDFEESKNIIMSSLDSKDRKQYFAKADDQTIGICTLFHSPDKVTIYGLGISKSHQGKGYGLDLINSMLSILKNKTIELEVDSLNEKAYNLYKKVGFQQIRAINYFEKSHLLVNNYIH